MILYLSSAIDDEYFAELVKKGYIKVGHQAQKFNSLVIRGLAEHTKVFAVSNPPYDLTKGEISPKTCSENNVCYSITGSNRSKLHKVNNFLQAKRYIKKISKENKIEAVVCDAVNVLASLNAILYSKFHKVPAIAIVTDIPKYLAKGKYTFFTRLMDYLIKKYDGYVLLTKAMDPLVNPNRKPYIIMEGLCEDSSAAEPVEEKTKNEVFTCVYTGSLALNTGIEELVKAVTLIERQDIKLKVYGNGILADSVKKAQENDSRIEYCGVVTNAEAVEAQRQADLLINPRPADVAYGHVSFPSKIMEYMASGTPLLTTKLPGIPEEYFDYLYLINDYSENGIKKSIETVMEYSFEDRNKFGSAARDFVLKNKNKTIQAKRIIELIFSM